jgi:hypothetical protein
MQKSLLERGRSHPTFVSASKVTAALSAADVANAGTVLVYVKNPGGTGIYMNQGGQVPPPSPSP